MRSTSRMIVFLIALGACWNGSTQAQPAKPGEPAVPDDFTSQGNLSPVTWRPVIWSFYIRTRNSGGEVFKGEMKVDTAKESTPTDIGVWEWLEPQIRIHRRAADQTAATEAQKAQLQADFQKVRDKLNQEKDNEKHRQLEAELQAIQDRLNFLDKQLQSGAFVGYGPDERVLSGWRRVVDPQTLATDVKLSGDGFNGNVTAEEAGTRTDLIGKPHPIDQFDLRSPVYLHFEPDILMTAGADFKDKVLRRNFSVTKLTISAHPVPKLPSDPEDPSSPVRARNLPVEIDPKNPTAVRIIQTIQSDGNRPLRWENFPFSGSHPIVFEFVLPKAGETLAEPGVWEFRVVASIQGRLNDDDPLETKQVEGAIRVAFRSEAFSSQVISKDDAKK